MLTFSILKQRLSPCYWNYPRAMKPLKWARWAQKECLCLLPEGGRRKLKWNQCTLEMNGYMLTSPVRWSQLLFCTAVVQLYTLRHSARGCWSSGLLSCLLFRIHWVKAWRRERYIAKRRGGTANFLPRERIPNPQSGTTPGVTSWWMVPRPSQLCIPNVLDVNSSLHCLLPCCVS